MLKEWVKSDKINISKKFQKIAKKYKKTIDKQ